MHCVFKCGLCALVAAPGEEGKPPVFLYIFAISIIANKRAMLSDGHEQDYVFEFKAKIQLTNMQFSAFQSTQDSEHNKCDTFLLTLLTDSSSPP